MWATQLRLRVSWRRARWDTWRQDTWAAGPLAAAAHMAGSRGRAPAAAAAVAAVAVVAALSAALGGVAARPGFAPALRPAPVPAGSARPAPGIDMDRIACRTIFFSFLSGKCAGCFLLRDEMSD